jgi:group II intron reverse transcriptase/maturase
MAKRGRWLDPKEIEVREMRGAERILGIIEDRGRRGLPLEDIYRQLYNPDLYLRGYGKIYRNDGAMTPGSTPETVDGMSLDKIRGIIESLKSERYRWMPVRRTYIEKKGSTKKRPLDIPTWSDKLSQEVMRSLLEAYYEPQFSPASHGFRPDRGCHTALTTIQRTWRGTTWFIEGDISKCFDSLDHTILLAILRRAIRDNRFLRLIENLLRAGYLDGWRYSDTYSGSPQGGIASPILANIYLDQLDKYVEMILLPGYNRGIRRKMSQEYTRLGHRMGRLRGEGFAEEAAQIRREMRSIPSVRLIDQDYRRLRYVRYADDFLLGFTGPRDEAEAIKDEVGRFLREELKLELSEEKTLITHAREEHARFLGYDITILGDSAKHRKGSGEHGSIAHRKGSGRITGTVALEVPAEVAREGCKSRTVKGKPAARVELVNESEYAIVLRYEAEFRGLANYYQLAHNRSTRLGRLEWIMRTSLLKTLAKKLRVSVREVTERFRVTLLS